jgi:phage RecT family recombinase
MKKVDVYEIVKGSEQEFKQIAQAHNAVSFAQECEFALQALEGNDYLYGVAEKNPSSLKAAILNIAGAGITLNPVFKHAYLVPRDGKICLDISYQGLIKLASDGGGISWVQAYVVHRNDSFNYTVGEAPKHDFNPFGDRGERVGAYCICKLKNGDILTEIMNLEQLHTIREASQSWKSYDAGKAKQTPWVVYEEEMFKKTVVKRAQKLWPKSDNGMRLEVAIAADNENSFDFGDKPEIEHKTAKELSDARAILYEELKGALSSCTKGMDLTQKGQFLMDHFGAKSFNYFEKRNIEQLEEDVQKAQSLVEVSADIEEVKTELVVAVEKPEKVVHKTARDVTFKL